MHCRMSSNIGDEDDENHDDNSDDGDSQAQEHEHDKIEDSESSASTPQSSQSSSNNMVLTPPHVLPKVDVTPGKLHRKKRNNRVEEKLLQMIEKPEPKHDEDKMFCLSLVATLKKITYLQRKELTKLKLQQSL